MNNILLLAILSHLLANASFATSQLNFVNTGSALKTSSRTRSLEDSGSVSIGQPNGASLTNMANLATVGSLTPNFAHDSSHAQAKTAPGTPPGRGIEVNVFPGGILFSGMFSGPNWRIVNDRSRALQGDTSMAIPEPGSMSLMGTGLFGLSLASFRKLQS